MARVERKAGKTETGKSASKAPPKPKSHTDRPSEMDENFEHTLRRLLGGRSWRPSA